MAENRPKRGNQILATLGVTLGAFALGSINGWTSPAAKMLLPRLNKGEMTDISLISSVALMGSAIAQPCVIFTIDRFGRKITMLLTAIPCMLGWLMIILGTNVPVVCVGRFITGFSGGSFCVAAPVYIGEIADKNIRGRLAVLYQLMLCIGVMFAYVLAVFNDFYYLTVPLLFVPLCYFICICFLPESPVYLLTKNPEAAKKSLQFYRGKNYDVAEEMKCLQVYAQAPVENFWTVFYTKPCLKAFGTLIVLHMAQQLSGIKALVFFAHPIFEMVGSSVSLGVTTVLAAVNAVIFTGLSIFIVDAVGRRCMMLVSLTIQAISLSITGFFFVLQRYNEEKAKSFTWVPIVFYCVTTASFSIGTGPIPWVMLGELLPRAVKRYCAPVVTCINYLSAFLVAETFPFLVTWSGIDTVFFLYASFCIIGAVLSLFFLVETKGKTLNEIQIALGGKGDSE